MTDINANVTACLVTKSHVGYDTYVNICSGVSKDVPWTALDWCSAGAVSLVCLMVVSAIAGLAYMMIADS
jgi:hypothetical protein